jgi:hypothetical protein
MDTTTLLIIIVILCLSAADGTAEDGGTRLGQQRSQKILC